MRVLVVTNLQADADAPQRGRWVHDQVDELRRLGVEAEVFSFPVGRKGYAPATRRLRSKLRRESFDLVHAHYGLAGLVAAAAGAKPLVVTYHGTDVRHKKVGALSRRLARRTALNAAVSRELFQPDSDRPGLPILSGRSAVLPCGPDLRRFEPMPRGEARKRLSLPPDEGFFFFPANPKRPEKRHDRAVELARACDAGLITGGHIDPEAMPLWLNAASVVLITSEYEGFGMAMLEALSCQVPVLSTPVGIAPFALEGIAGCLAEPFDVSRWKPVAEDHLGHLDPRVAGAGRAAHFSAERMAARVLVAYEEVLGADGT
jgi:glycosyltransferase involved in cell wall biosynthesis